MRITADLQGILLTLALSGTQAAAGQDYGSKELLESLNCVGVEFVDCRLLDPSHRAECGISVKPVYIGEVFTNTRGGISTDEATRYQALLDLPLTLDLEKLDVPVPGTFFLLAQNTHGRGLTEDFVGDAQVLSNIDSFDNIMQVSEYWWEFGLCDDDVVVRLGKQDLNTEFLLMQSASDFIHSSFGLTPAAEVPSYPNPSMAAVLLANLTPSLRLKVGIWDTVVDGGTWGFSGNNVKLSIGELEYDYAVSDGRLPGTLALGIAYSSAGRHVKGGVSIGSRVLHSGRATRFP